MKEKKERKYEIILTKKQQEFYKAFLNKKINEILIWGWARWWKTWWVWEIILLTMILYPWIVWLVWRREWDDLRKTSLQNILKILNKKWMKEKEDFRMNYQTKELLLKNWSKIYFMPLKQQPSDPEFNFLGWYEITFFFIDEAQEVSEKVLSILKSRCTEKIKEYNLVWKWFLSCNPLKCWLYDRYIKPRKEWTLSENLIFIPSLYLDNPYMDHRKYEKMYEDADEVTKERLLKWNWEYDDTPWKLYEYNDILNIFSREVEQEDLDMYISIDWATEWKDKAVLLIWRWFEIVEAKIWDKCTTKDIEDYAKLKMSEYNIRDKNVVNDHVWIWAWISYWIWNNVFKFNSNSSEIKKKAKDPQIFNRLRDQVYFELKKHIKKITVRDKELNKYKEIIIRELDVIAQIDIDKWWPQKIIKKEDIKKLIWHSPDFADAIAMRMIYECNRKKRLSFF